jgi:hypothetical protein
VDEVINYLLEQNGEKFGELLLDASTGKLRTNLILLLNRRKCDFDDRFGRERNRFVDI